MEGPLLRGEAAEGRVARVGLPFTAEARAGICAVAELVEKLWRRTQEGIGRSQRRKSSRNQAAIKITCYETTTQMSMKQSEAIRGNQKPSRATRVTCCETTTQMSMKPNVAASSTTKACSKSDSGMGDQRDISGDRWRSGGARTCSKSDSGTGREVDTEEVALVTRDSEIISVPGRLMEAGGDRRQIWRSSEGYSGEIGGAQKGEELPEAKGAKRAKRGWIRRSSEGRSRSEGAQGRGCTEGEGGKERGRPLELGDDAHRAVGVGRVLVNRVLGPGAAARWRAPARLSHAEFAQFASARCSRARVAHQAGQLAQPRVQRSHSVLVPSVDAGRHDARRRGRGRRHRSCKRRRSRKRLRPAGVDSPHGVICLKVLISWRWRWSRCRCWHGWVVPRTPRRRLLLRQPSRLCNLFRRLFGAPQSARPNG